MLLNVRHLLDVRVVILLQLLHLMLEVDLARCYHFTNLVAYSRSEPCHRSIKGRFYDCFEYFALDFVQLQYPSRVTSNQSLGRVFGTRKRKLRRCD